MDDGKARTSHLRKRLGAVSYILTLGLGTPKRPFDRCRPPRPTPFHHRFNNANSSLSQVTAPESTKASPCLPLRSSPSRSVLRCHQGPSVFRHCPRLFRLFPHVNNPRFTIMDVAEPSILAGAHSSFRSSLLRECGPSPKSRSGFTIRKSGRPGDYDVVTMSK